MRLGIEEGNSNQSISVSYFLVGVTNFRDRVNNWKDAFGLLSPSENEAFGSHLSFYNGHVTLFAIIRYGLGVFRIDPIFRTENFIFPNHVTSWGCHTWPWIFQAKTESNDIGHVTHPRLRRARYLCLTISFTGLASLHIKRGPRSSKERFSTLGK